MSSTTYCLHISPDSLQATLYSGSSEIRLGNSKMILPATVAQVCFRLREHIAPGAVNRDILTLPHKK